MISGYTPSQLARALARIKDVKVPARVTHVTVAQDGQGKCLVRIAEERREEALGIEFAVTLTSEETRAWRAECHRIANEDAGSRGA